MSLSAFTVLFLCKSREESAGGLGGELAVLEWAGNRVLSTDKCILVCRYGQREDVETGFAGGFGFVGFGELYQSCRCEWCILCNNKLALAIGSGDTLTVLLDEAIIGQPFVVQVSTDVVFIQDRLLVKLAGEQILY